MKRFYVFGFLLFFISNAFIFTICGCESIQNKEGFDDHFFHLYTLCALIISENYEEAQTFYQENKSVLQVQIQQITPYLEGHQEPAWVSDLGVFTSGILGAFLGGRLFLLEEGFAAEMFWATFIGGHLGMTAVGLFWLWEDGKIELKNRYVREYAERTIFTLNLLKEMRAKC